MYCNSTLFGLSSQRFLTLTLLICLVCISCTQSQIVEDVVIPEESRYQLMEEFCYSNGNCYKIWKFSPPKTKYEAAQHCRSQGNYTLATITKRADEIQLNKQIDPTEAAWTGLSLSPSPTWKWLHKTGWYENILPDSMIDSTIGSCLIATRSSIFSHSCNRDLSYICEFDQEPLIGCDLGTNQLNLTTGATWLCVNSEKTEWVEAARRCTQDDGSLVIINNQEKLTEVQRVLSDVAGANYFWTAGTKVPLTWDQRGVDSNPYSLIWSERITDNPNLDEADRVGAAPYCVVLSHKQGLYHKKCQDRLSQAICSKKNPSPELGITSSTIAALNMGSTTTGLPKDDKRNYKAVIICAYILAILVIIGLVVLLIVFVIRRKKKRVKGKDQLFDSSTKRNGTLGRKNTDPESEWDKVIAENGVEAVQMRHKGSSKDIDIIHNVPLDPRASVEQPLYVPKESEVVPVTLQRAKSKASSASLVSSEVATFNGNAADRRSGSTNSSVLIKVAPPVPPKLKYARSQSAPASELEPLTSRSSYSPDTEEATWEFPPPPAELLTEDETPTSPPLPPKPVKKPPARRHRKKHIVPDPIYAKIDKSRTAPKGAAPPPPPQSAKPGGRFTTLPTRLQRQAQVPPDTSDSGIDMGLHSPPQNHNNNMRLAASSDNIASLKEGPPIPPALKQSAELQLLDDILAHLESS